VKILAITDIHSSIVNVKKLVNTIHHIDLIAVIGDISHFGPFKRAIQILRLLTRIGVPVFFVPGNCDPPSLLQWEDLEQNIFNLHGRNRKFREFFFAGVGGSIISPFRTLIEFSEEEYSKILNNAIRHLDDLSKLILIAHNPPYNTRLDLIRNNIHVGSLSVRKFVEEKQPLLLVTGHIHESRGVDQIGRTKMVNPGPLKWGYYALVNVNDEKVDIFLEKI